MYSYNETEGYLAVKKSADKSRVFMISDKLSVAGPDPVHLLNFTADTEVNSLVAGNYSAVWQHISVSLDATNQICLNVTVCDIFTLAFTDGTAVDLMVNLYSSTFREVKMYTYRRSPAELKYSYHVQADPDTEQLDFYFPLTGTESTNYWFDATSPSTLTSNPLTGVSWDAAPDDGILMCPPGYVNNVNAVIQSDPAELPTCISKLQHSITTE